MAMLKFMGLRAQYITFFCILKTNASSQLLADSYSHLSWPQITGFPSAESQPVRTDKPTVICRQELPDAIFPKAINSLALVQSLES